MKNLRPYLAVLLSLVFTCSVYAQNPFTLSANSHFECLTNGVATLNCNDTFSIPYAVHNNSNSIFHWQQQSTLDSSEILICFDKSDVFNRQAYINTVNAIKQYIPDFKYDTVNLVSTSVFQSKLLGKKLLIFSSLSVDVIFKSFYSINAGLVQNFINQGGMVIVCGDEQLPIANSLGLFHVPYNKILSYDLYTTLANIKSYAVRVNNETPLTDSIANDTIALLPRTYLPFIYDDSVINIYLSNGLYSLVSYKNIGKGKAIYIGYNYLSFNSNQARIITNAIKWVTKKSPEGNIHIVPSTGNVLPGQTDTILMKVCGKELIAGNNTLMALIKTNDSAILIDSLQLIVNVSSKPCANFFSAVYPDCSGAVKFTDQSIHSPTSWYWDFGDGQNSTIQNPIHKYVTSGVFSVKLIISSNYGSDSIVKLINIINVGGPMPTSATHFNYSNAQNFGLTNFSIGSLHTNTSTAEEGYRDFTCNTIVNLPRASTIPLSMNFFTLATQYINIYIDVNDDGILTSNELFLNDTTKDSFSYSGSILSPSNVALYSPLRLRVIVGQCGYTNNLLVNCQAEDYTVIFVDTTSTPIAGFTTSDTLTSTLANVYLNNLSVNNPSANLWTMTGATPNISTLTNPIIKYDSTGEFDIKLKVSNSHGMNSIQRHMRVINGYKMCSNGINAICNDTSGILYDSGGPDGNTGINENCYFTINPQCADTIYISLLEYSTNCVIIIGSYQVTYFFGVTNFLIVGNSVTIRWISTLATTSKGFKLYWRSHQKNGTPPKANFTFDKLYPSIFDTVSFSNSCSPNTIKWFWDFGDGTTSNLPNPKHSYLIAGNYSVKLVAQSCLNNYDTITKNITIHQGGHFSISPKVVSYGFMNCFDTVYIPLVIHNNFGGGTLNWKEKQGNGTLKTLIWYYGADTTYSHSYRNTISAIKTYLPNFSYDSTSTTLVPFFRSMLEGKNLLIIPENFSGAGSIVTQFSTDIFQFVKNGGTVIICADQNYTSVKNTGLFTMSTSIENNTDNANMAFYYSRLTAGISDNTISLIVPNYLPVFTCSDLVRVYTYKSCFDVASYRNIGLGKAIYLGYTYEVFNSPQARLLANAVNWATELMPIQKTKLIPDFGSILPGTDDTISLRIINANWKQGLDSQFVILSTNDTAHLLDTIKIETTSSFAPCAQFSSFYDEGFCSGKYLFIDQTAHHPTQWFWDFGDGYTDTIQNPTHTYLETGNYFIKLVATNSFGVDTITQGITINQAGAPINTSCFSYTNTTCCNYGITNFTLGDINSTSGDATEGYRDFTCVRYTNIIKGSHQQFSITSLSSEVQYLNIWLDLDDNGFVSSNEFLIKNKAVNSYPYQGTITFPTSLPINVSLRLRVILSTDNNNPGWGAINYGQAEDYAITIVDPKPTIKFDATSNEVYTLQPLQLIDNSTNNPTSWEWKMTGANPSTSSLQNPMVNYEQSGVYDVTLKATNNYGSNTVTKTSFIKVKPLPILLFTDSVDYCLSRKYFISNVESPYHTVLWDFGDGDSSILNATTIANHTYPNFGNYQVKMVAKADFINDTVIKDYYLEPWLVHINYSGAKQNHIPLRLVVQNSPSYFTKYAWNFGDNILSNHEAPFHTFMRQGLFNISLNLQDQFGCEIMVYDTLQIGLSNINVFPSPFSNSISVLLDKSLFTKKLSVNIFNTSGVLVFSKQEENVTINKAYIIEPKINDGIYFLNFKTDDIDHNCMIMKN